MIKAVIFDFDGLIIDTETPSYMALKEIYQEYGIELLLPVYAQCIGTSFQLFNPYTYLSEQVEVDMEEVRIKFKRDYAILLEQSELRPGVVEYLINARQLNLRIGLASSSSLSWIEPLLTRYKIAEYFDTVQTSDNVKNVKPDPELYIKALEALDVKGKQAISFEDSLNGFKSAKSAGLNCVIVPNEVTRHFEFAEYDLMIESMADMGLEEIIENINVKNRLKK
jgi:putative hydrolase of the HAD superfamily